jgi:acetyl-CoA acetyltransferase
MTNRLHEIPAKFLPERAGRDVAVAGLIRSAQTHFVGCSASLQNLTSIASHISAGFDALVAGGMKESRPNILVYLNSEGMVGIAIGDEEVDMVQEARELYPKDFPRIVFRPGNCP